MENNSVAAWIGVVFCVIILLVQFSGVTQPDVLDEKDVELIVGNAISNLSIPTVEEFADLIVIPQAESADNELLNEFLERKFSDEYNEIEDAAEEYALEELEDKDYRIVVDYLKSLVIGLDEDSVDVDVEETEVTVTKLGLEDDEDKSAVVTFELEVEYELEEGVVEDYKKKFVVIYNVEFDEGDFSDEDVNFVSII